MISNKLNNTISCNFCNLPANHKNNIIINRRRRLLRTNKMTTEKINKLMENASKSKKLKGILSVNSEPLVSSDFNHNPSSSNFDLTQTQVIESTFGRVLSWYDNEWGFSNRMCDIAEYVSKIK